MDPSTLSVQVNDTNTIQIKVDNISNLSAFELHLSFNPVVLEVTGVANGGFVVADFVAQNTFDNAAGTIDYAIAQMNRFPAQGSGSLLNISFRAKAGGSSAITTRPTPAASTGLLLSDQNGVAIQASWQPGTINVGSSTISTNTPTSTSTPSAKGQDLTQLDQVALANVRNIRIGFVFQSHYLLPHCTVWENVLVPTLAASPPAPLLGGDGGGFGGKAPTAAGRIPPLASRVCVISQAGLKRYRDTKP